MTFYGSKEVDTLFRIAGLLGFFFYTASFAALQFKVIDGQGLTYSALDLLAASMVPGSLIGEVNLASALIQGSWITIGCAGILLRIAKARSASRPRGSFPAARDRFARP